MKRLTFMDGFKEPCYRIDGTVYKNEVAQRLSAYEDAGLTPNQVRKISNVLRQFGEEYNCWFDYVAGFMCKYASAEQDGRLVVLPCKAGDTVYKIFCREIVSALIEKIEINAFTNPPIWVQIGTDFMASQCYRFDMSCGRDFFLTREEAEAALEAQKGGNA